jgi:N-acetylglucosamine-6-sulfatase
MPILQAELVNNGVTFRNGFVTAPLCCPSRATFLRGQYAHNHTVETNTSPKGGETRFREVGCDRSTVATWLQNAGYRTALFGKYLNAYKDTYIPPGWERWFAAYGRAADQRFNDQGSVVDYPPERHHWEDVITEQAIAWLDGLAASEEPFFLYLASHAPHQPATPAKRHADRFSDEPLPRPLNFNERDVADKPQWVRDTDLQSDERIRRMQRLYRNRLRTLLGVDEMIGRLLDTLRGIRRLDDTYVFYVSDHGFHLGEHRQYPGKRSPYEEDIRIPMIVRGPGVARGATRDHLVVSNDFAPTLAELVGADIPDFVDGRSMVPLLGEEPPPVGEYRQRVLFSQIRSKTTRGPSPIPTYLGVRTLSHSYVEYETGERELYNLQEDPYQLHNLPVSGNEEVHRHVTGELASLKGCAGSGCRTMEATHLPWPGRPTAEEARSKLWRRILGGSQ